MSRKLFGSGLLLVVGIGLSMAGRVSSQDKQDLDKGSKGVGSLVLGSGPANLEQLVQELKNVRAQKAELEKREEQLTAEIEKKINEERQLLDQKIDLRRRQLQEIERLIHGDFKHKEGKAVEKRYYKK